MEKVSIINIKTDKAEDNVVSLRQRIRQLREELFSLDEGTAEYEAKAQELGNALHQQNEAIETARLATDDFGQKLSNTTSVINGGIAAVTGITAALSLMGVEITDDTKLMKFLVSAMAITQSIETIDTASKAFKGLAASIKASAAAQRIFNTAMKANPVMLIVSGVAALVTGLIALNEHLKKSNAEAAEAEARAQRIAEASNSIAGSDPTQAYQYRKMEIEGASREELKKFATEEYETNIKTLQSLKDQAATLEEKAAIQEKINDLKNKEEKYLDNYHLETLKIQEEEKKAAEERKKQARERAKQLAEQKKAAEEAYKASLPTEFDKQRNKLEQDYINGLMTELDYKFELNRINQEEWNALSDREKAQQSNIERSLQLQSEYVTLLEERKTKSLELKEIEASNLATLNQTDSLQQEQTARQTYLETTSGPDVTDDARIKAEQVLQETLYQIQLQGVNRELELLKFRHEQGLISTEEYNKSVVELELQKTNLQQSEADRRLQIAKDEQAKQKEIDDLVKQQKQDLTNATASFLGAFAENLDEETTAYKHLKAAEAIINTLSASVAAFAGITKDTGGWGVAAAAVQAAAVIATGMATVRQIYAVNTNGGSNSTSYSMSSAAATTLDKNYTNARLTDGSGAELNLKDAFSDIKVIVSANEITNVQSNMKKVKVQNTF